MLKFEKISKTRQLNVILRDKPNLFTKTFLLALSYALFIHLFAIFMFQIPLFKIGYTESVFPPVLVGIDIPLRDSINNLSFQLDEEEAFPSYLIAPFPEVPRLSIVSEQALIRKMEQIKDPNLLNNPFASIENDVALQHIETIFEPPKNEVPIKIYLSGALAETATMKTTGIEQEFAKLFFIEHPEKAIEKRFIFAVQLEQESGKLFWWENLYADDESHFKLLAQNLLKSLEFDSTAHFVENGFIEIVFSADEKL